MTSAYPVLSMIATTDQAAVTTTPHHTHVGVIIENLRVAESTLDISGFHRKSMSLVLTEYDTPSNVNMRALRQPITDNEIKTMVGGQPGLRVFGRFENDQDGSYLRILTWEYSAEYKSRRNK